MNRRVKKSITFLLRWGIAVGGIWWVVANMSFHDHVLVLVRAARTGEGRPVQALLAEPAEEDAPAFLIHDPQRVRTKIVLRDQLVCEPDAVQASVRQNGQTQSVQVLGLQMIGSDNHNPQLQRLLVADGPDAPTRWIAPADVVGGYPLPVPHPLVTVGLASMLRQARLGLLCLALLIIPITSILCSYRWYELLKALDIHIRLSRAFVLTMVGSFYSTFMPGSTGGDLLKAYYASKQTPHRARAVLSVFIDRVIGLIALVMLGGAMAAWGYAAAPDVNDPAAQACRKVAIASVAILAVAAGGFYLLNHPAVRKRLGFDRFLQMLPMQKHVQEAMHVMEVFRRRATLVFWALLVTLPVHVAVVLSAMCAGKAFALPISPTYYFVIVPVIVLVGSIPISPQGAGVMEFFAIRLTQRQGVTISQVFALTMSIRLAGILWNLVGGLFVLRGGYHAPTAVEQKELEAEDEPAVS